MSIQVCRWLAVAAVCTVGFQTPAAEPFPQSNTVPSSQLIAAMTLIKSAGQPDVVGGVILYQEGGHGTGAPRQLTMSEGEFVVFSVEDQSVTCQTGNDCRLPYIPDAVYKAELRRYNSEIFQSQIVLPEATGIVSPAPQSTFPKNQPITFEWTPSRAQTHGVALSTFLSGTNCSLNGSVLWEKNTSAEAPGDYVTGCADPIKARFTVFFVNVNGIPRLGGSLKGYSDASYSFTYGDANSADESTSPAKFLNDEALAQSSAGLIETIQEIESPGSDTTVLVK